MASVLGQTFKDLELIIVDDGSIDMTSLLPAYYSNDSRVRYIKLEHSGLPGLVRNRGTELAGGRYVAFLDSDDLWVSGKIEKQLAFFEENPSCRVVHTREEWIRNGRVISQVKFNHKRSGDIFSDALEKCIIGPSTVMLEKSLYTELGGFDGNLEIAEDYELWLRLCNSNKVGYIDEALVTKRAGHGDQLSEKYGHIEIFRIRGLQKLVEQRYFNEINQNLAEKELSRKCRIYAAGCRKRNKPEEAEMHETLADRYGK